MSVQREEQLARKRQRDRERGLAKARENREKETRRSRAEIIREELARRSDCRCGITPSTTPDELRALGAGCTAGQWVCECLAAIRRRLKL